MDLSTQFDERMWTVYDLIVAVCMIGLWQYHRMQEMNSSWPMLVLGVGLLGEGTYFVTRDLGIEGANLAIQFIAGGMWWLFVISLMRIKRPTNHACVGGVCLGLALLLAVAFLLTFRKLKPVAMLLFIGWFEPAQLLIWTTALGLAICKFKGQEQKLALCLMASHMCLYFAHVFLVYIRLAKLDYSQFLPYLSQCVGITGMTITLHHMVELGMFNVVVGKNEEALLDNVVDE